MAQDTGHQSSPFSFESLTQAYLKITQALVQQERRGQSLHLKPGHEGLERKVVARTDGPELMLVLRHTNIAMETVSVSTDSNVQLGEAVPHRR
jgi:hypothetical protein